MNSPKPDPEMHAVNTIVQSLRPLDAEAQQRVLQSSLALLGLAIAGRPQATSEISMPSSVPGSPGPSPAHTSQKPKGLTELLLEKKPGTNSQRIVLFAFYRRNVEGIETFQRQELKSYFARARIAPPGNYDRDFATAVSVGWIHEDDDKSYLTTTGEQLVAAGFDGERTHPKPSKRTKKKSLKTGNRKTTKKTPRRK